MLVYLVQWKADSELTKGKGRITSKDFMYVFTVLCRNSHDATACLEYLFNKEYYGKFSLSDGEITLRRMKLDSRSFEIQYLFMDGIKKPISFRNLDRSLSDYNASLYKCVSSL